jgi:hypothetical protein
MIKNMLLRLGNNGCQTLKFQIRDTEIADLWIERMQSRGHYTLDHPDRFYGFGTLAEEQARAVLMIKQCIVTINAYKSIIHREFEYTQDCLNYLHNIFEQYHGLLDQQTVDYWQDAPVMVRKALADLNLAVHRCESVAHKLNPRFVCTWYGMPKVKQLSPELQKKFGTSNIEFGTVYLTYCEIGKTVEDLANDNDTYIGNDAFRPFSSYSADFNVALYNRDLTESHNKIQQYIDQRQEFFLAHDITSVYNVKAQPCRFPVADLLYSGNKQEVLSLITQNQWVHEVTLE